MNFRALLPAVVSIAFALGLIVQAGDANYVPELNLYLRSAFEYPSSADEQAAFKLNEARFEVMGRATSDLSYRVRYRLNESQLPNSLDNAPASLDLAFVDYRFGASKKYSLTVGKQAAFVGSWEFEKNPTYEYQYSKFVNNQVNIFLLAAKLGYEINDDHSIHVQLHNTFDNDFDTRHTLFGYDTNGFEEAKAPLGVYISWLGNLLDDRVKTFWSYNISQFAKGETNHSIALGTKLVLPKFEIYLDLATANYPVDYPGIASSSINAVTGSDVFAQDVDYRTAVVRLDYNFASKWYLTAKGIYETARVQRDNYDGRHLGALIGVEYKPFDDQNMKLFSYYYANDRRISLPGTDNSSDADLLAFGVLFFVDALQSLK